MLTAKYESVGISCSRCQSFGGSSLVSGSCEVKEIVRSGSPGRLGRLAAQGNERLLNLRWGGWESKGIIIFGLIPRLPASVDMLSSDSCPRHQIRRLVISVCPRPLSSVGSKTFPVGGGVRTRKQHNGDRAFLQEVKTEESD